jgi:hypothetical protein
MDAEGPRLPIGRSGRLEAVALTGPDGDGALLILDADEPRALVAGRVGGGTAERLVVTAMREPVETAVDADAVAAWLASAPLGTGRGTPEGVPAWASLVGLVLLVAVVAFALIGSAVSFAWLVETFGG